MTFKNSRLAALVGAFCISSAAFAAEVSIQFNEADGVTPPPVVYDFANMTIDANGKIIINNATYRSGTFPGVAGEAGEVVLGCGANTELNEATRLCVGTGGGNTSSSASSVSSVSSTSSSSSAPAAGNCPVPSGVSVENRLYDWKTSTSQLTLNLSRAGVHSYPITTTSNTQYNGQLSVIPFSNTGNIGKEIWISECPGGEPLHATMCKKNGVQPTLFWGQSQMVARCVLETNKNYFINVKNTASSCNAANGCNTKLQLLVNGTPD